MKEIHDIDLKALIENETGQKFNKGGYICCPFHTENTGSFSVRFDSNANKDKFKCFGCKETGDAIDFISKLKGLDYNSSREYLGLEVKKSENELEIEKIESYIDWQLKNFEDMQEFKLLGLFQFVNEDNIPIYYKAKFLKPDGKKITPYYHLEGDRVINSRGHDEVPYNLYNTIRAIDDDKVIIFVEGEKDANTLNRALGNSKYVATSIKGCKDLSLINKEDMKIFVISDTGEAGQKYIEDIKQEFLDNAKVFKIINLPGLAKLGNNKDVTDWLETGHNKFELFKAFKRSLDLKNKDELQQDWKGIYKLYWDKKDEEYKKFYLTDFQLLEAKRLIYVDDEKEGVKLTFKSSTGDIITRSHYSSVFDDVKSFRNFLGTLDLSFLSKNIEDLITFKKWINNYFAIENESIYNGAQWIKKGKELHLITSDGGIGANTSDHSLITDTDSVKILDKEKISTNELKELRGKLLKFWEPEKSVSIIGTVINDLAAWHSEESGFKQHILLIVGESQSGKSTILEKVIAPILNINPDDKKSMSSSPFSIQVDLSKGNYPVIYDEFKPSMMDKYKIKKMSDIFRSAFDRHSMNKGDKSFKVREFKLRRPLIVAGEENFPNSETAVITRSCIVYLSRRERTEKNSEAMKWLVENQDILNKFGRSLVDILLKMSIEEYRQIIKSKEKYFKNLKERVLNTALNIACGIEIYNKLLKKHGLNEITNYEEFIYKNLKEEILEDGEDAKSLVEKMLILYNDMIETGRAFDVNNVIINRGDGLFIKTSEMINQIHMFVKQVESAELVPLKLKDFKKQASKSGYLEKMSSKVILVDSKSVRFDEYSKERMRELQVSSIIEAEITQIEMTDKDRKVIEGVFGAKVP